MFLQAAGIKPDTYTTLWETPIYPVCESRYEAVQMALIVYRMAKGSASPEEIRRWQESPKMSLCQSFNEANTKALYEWLYELENRILSSRFIWALEDGVYYREALKLPKPRNHRTGVPESAP